ncbi:roadblock/LC7 domain-containing protein, partial [Schumannella luteola]
DGFEIARATQHGGTDERLASMASSLQALGEAIARELGLGDSEYALIEAHHGRVLLRRIANQPIILAGVFDDDETVGKAISVSRKLADELSAELASAR